MVEPFTIAGTLALVKGALDSAKSLQDLLKKDAPDVVALRERIQDLRSQLLDAKDGLLKMREVNQEQAEQIAQLRVKKIRSDAEPHLIGDYYYFVEPGKSPSGPCCPNCWNTANERRLLSEIPETFKRLESREFECSKCKAGFRQSRPSPSEIQIALQD